MKAVVLHEYGPPANLKYEEFDAPQPGPAQVLIEVHAAGVNPVDWKMRSGAAKEIFPVAFPAILGFDVAGTVKACGAGVHGFTEGDRIFGRVSGAYAALAIGKASDLAHIPEGVDFIAAAALPVIATTADQLVRVAANCRPGQTVLLTGALGSVGRLALFCALELGVKVIAGVRKRHIAEALALGATSAIDISDDEALANVGPLDAVADTLGGALAPKLLALVKPGGHYASIVGPPQDTTRFPDVHVNAFGSQSDTAATVRFAEAVRDGKVKLPIGLVLPLSQAAEAHTKGEAGGIGKIVLAAK